MLVTLSGVHSEEQRAAPFPLRIVQEFVNSRDQETRADDFSTSAAAARWFVAAGILKKSVRVSSRDLQQIKALREAFLCLLVINAGSPERSVTPALLKQLRDTPVRLDVDAHGRLAVSLAPLSSTTQALCQLVGITFSAQESGTWPRLKACGNVDCRWVFYDNSRNRSGTWCAMQECGNRLKNRKYRNRHRDDR